MCTTGPKFGDYHFKENITTIYYYAFPYMVVGVSYMQIK